MVKTTKKVEIPKRKKIKKRKVRRSMFTKKEAL